MTTRNKKQIISGAYHVNNEMCSFFIFWVLMEEWSLVCIDRGEKACEFIYMARFFQIVGKSPKNRHVFCKMMILAQIFLAELGRMEIFVKNRPFD